MAANKTEINVEEARKVAKLARLELSEAECQDMARDLSQILGYVKKLDELDTKNIEATAHAVELNPLLREDEVQLGLPVEKALKNAPERMGDGFGVPKIIE